MRFLMRETLISPEDLAAIQLLTDRFTLREDHVQRLLALAAGDRVLVESALLVAREMGYQSFEGAHQYIVDVLRLPKQQQ
ncbi:MAG: hypothetical protein ACI906_001713 [Candidatus Latescibacterota bacterium]|jgi:hypothetical protein